MQYTNLLTHLPRRGLNPGQEENLEKILKSSKKFHREAGIEEIEPGVNSDTIVLESGHQPNFLPHSGTWRKIYLLDRLSKGLRSHKKNTVALYGIHDQNLSTADLLYRNKIPAINKDGCIHIGFRIKDVDRYKPFDRVEKPSKAEWEKELTEIRKHYEKYAKAGRPDGKETLEDLEELLGIMRASYDAAGNFANLNAYVTAKIASEKWGLNVCFFRYSDVQKEGVFKEERLKILENGEGFRSLYNEAIDLYGLGIRRMEPDSLPFWYHCSCGAKIPLKEEMICEVCKTGIHVDDNEKFLERHLSDMDATAVSRNLIFAQGLGTAVFVSGRGGSLEYGRISAYIAEKWGLNQPVTVAAGGKDRYLGPVHNTIIKDICQSFGLVPSELTEKDMVEAKVRRKIAEAEKKALHSTSKADAQKYAGSIVFYKRQLDMASKIFILNPSAMDFFASVGIDEAGSSWKSLLSSGMQESGPYLFAGHDLSYGNGSFDAEYVKKVCSVFSTLEVN